MNGIIHTARMLFILLAGGLLAASIYVVMNRSAINGDKGLGVLAATVAAIGVIASWNPRRSDQ